MSRLVLELVLASASTSGMIRSIEIDGRAVTVWRGPARIKARDFDIARCCAARGRAMLAAGPGSG